jgi:hypothetical protein
MSTKMKFTESESKEIVILDGKKVPELQAVGESKALRIKKAFEPMTKMLGGFEDAFNEVISEAESGEITPELMAKAKRLRLDIGKIRIKTGKLKDKEKQEARRESKAIQGVHNILVWAVKDKEDKLKEIEKHYERIEEQRIEQLQSERVEALSPYVEDAEERRLGDMDTDVWEAYFNGKKQQYLDRVEAERIAEEERKEKERIAAIRAEREKQLRPYFQFVPDNHPDFGELEDSEWEDFFAEMKQAKEVYDKEQEKIRKENERLQKEAKKAAEKAKKERKAREKEEAKRKAKEEEERKARQAAEREAKRKQEELESKLKAKEEAERKAKEEEEKRKQAELSKKDSDKIKDLVKSLENIKTSFTFESKKNKAMYKSVGELIDKTINYINQKQNK